MNVTAVLQQAATLVQQHHNCGCNPQVTGLATTFNSTDLKATVFLPKNAAFDTLFSSLGLTASQVLSSTSPFIPYLGQVRAQSNTCPVTTKLAGKTGHLQIDIVAPACVHSQRHQAHGYGKCRSWSTMSSPIRPSTLQISPRERF